MLLRLPCRYPELVSGSVVKHYGDKYIKTPRKRFCLRGVLQII